MITGIRSKQAGVTFIGLMFFFMLAVSAIWIGFKVAPTYYNQRAVQKMLDTLITEFEDSTDAQIRESFQKRLDVGFIEEIKAGDLEIDRKHGPLKLTVVLDHEEPLVDAVSIRVKLIAEAVGKKDQSAF